jgi:hypothetical protein
MNARPMIRRIHMIAGIVAFLMILTFWSLTIASELSGNHTAVAAVKHWILWGMLLLVPAMAAVGGTGFKLGARSAAPIVLAKKRRMPVIAMNGVLVLVPAAFFLAGRSAAGVFDGSFYAAQAIELTAGAVNLVLLGLNMRDGLRLTGRLKRLHAMPQDALR